MDALSSTVPMKINCDLQLTLMASSLYRLLGTRLGGAYTTPTYSPPGSPTPPPPSPGGAAATSNSPSAESRDPRGVNSHS